MRGQQIRQRQRRLNRTVSQHSCDRKEQRQCTHTGAYYALAAVIVVSACVSVNTELAGVLAREALIELVKGVVQLAVAGR